MKMGKVAEGQLCAFQFRVLLTNCYLFIYILAVPTRLRFIDHVLFVYCSDLWCVFRHAYILATVLETSSTNLSARSVLDYSIDAGFILESIVASDTLPEIGA